MKLDLKQKYNNARIKGRDEQKVVFIILEELFELTVMFFSLTNLLVMFQFIINKLLRKLM